MGVAIATTRETPSDGRYEAARSTVGATCSACPAGGSISSCTKPNTSLALSASPLAVSRRFDGAIEPATIVPMRRSHRLSAVALPTHAAAAWAAPPLADRTLKRGERRKAFPDASASLTLRACLFSKRTTALPGLDTDVEVWSR